VDRMSAPRLTVSEAALLARTTEDEVRAARRSGELRSLSIYHVRAWIRSRIVQVRTSRQESS